MNVLDNLKSLMTLPIVLYLDNCGRENTNRYVLGFYDLLLAKKIIKKVSY